MAGPLSGIGQGQQIPLATSFQPGQSNVTQVRPQNEDGRDTKANQVEPQGTQAAGAQNSETGNQDVVRSRREDVSSSRSGDTSGDASARRGSLVDITV